MDKPFVCDLPDNKDSALIVRSTIDLAHDPGLKLVVEGAESEATCDFLVRLGCDVAQGYHLGRPVSAASLKEWLSRYPLASP